jgi:hypothetical protein
MNSINLDWLYDSSKRQIQKQVAENLIREDLSNYHFQIKVDGQIKDEDFFILHSIIVR